MESEVTLVLRDVPYHVRGDCVGVEKGAYALVRDGQSLMFAIGDFDSVSEVEYQSIIIGVKEIIKVSPIKDETDSELAIKWCLDKGYEIIHVYGALNDRLDHQHVNLQLAYKYPSVILYDEHNKIQAYEMGEHTLTKDAYTYFSVFAYASSNISLKGFNYPLEKHNLSYDEMKTISNQWIKKDAQLIVHQGKVLVYLTR